jgi:sulfur relay (sulfurtransferase) DsrC/TusE family protein
MRTIYIDMDGVVADFDTFAEKILERKIGWGTTQDLTDEEWLKLASVDRLYYQLPMMPDATKLIAYIKSLNTRFHIEFLTAIPRRTTIPSAQAGRVIRDAV